MHPKTIVGQVEVQQKTLGASCNNYAAPIKYLAGEKSENINYQGLINQLGKPNENNYKIHSYSLIPNLCSVIDNMSCNKQLRHFCALVCREHQLVVGVIVIEVQPPLIGPIVVYVVQVCILWDVLQVQIVHLHGKQLQSISLK